MADKPDQERMTELEKRVAAQQVVINNLRQWLSDAQLQLAEAAANWHLANEHIKNIEDSTN